jgi:hypothetical protein
MILHSRSSFTRKFRPCLEQNRTTQLKTNMAKIKVFLWLITHHSMKPYRVVELQLLFSALGGAE